MTGYVLGSSFVGPLADHINPRYIFVVEEKKLKIKTTTTTQNRFTQEQKKNNKNKNSF